MNDHRRTMGRLYYYNVHGQQRKAVAPPPLGELMSYVSETFINPRMVIVC